MDVTSIVKVYVTESNDVIKRIVISSPYGGRQQLKWLHY